MRRTKWSDSEEGRYRFDFGTWYRRWGWINLVLLPPVVVLLGLSIWRWRNPVYDLIVLNGRVFNGERMLPPGTGLAIRDGRITKVGFVHGLRSKATINAWRRVVAPGFIDTHVHIEPESSFRAPNFVAMGVTTVVSGNCGGSVKEIGKLLSTLDRKGAQVNFAILVGHRTVREAVMGRGNRAAPTPAQLDEMRLMVYRGMDEGALGFSTGLEYDPGVFAERAEIVALTEVVAPWNGIYATHVRNEGLEYRDALQEAIDTASRAEVHLHISHLKIAAKARWGEMEQALEMLGKARPGGREVTQDAYAYDASSSSLDLLLPAEFRGLTGSARQLLEDPQRRAKLVTGMLAKLRREGFEDYSHVQVAYFHRELSLRGKKIDEVASLLPTLPNSKSPASDWLAPFVPDPKLRGQLRAILYLFANGGAQMVYHVIDENRNLPLVLKSPQTVIGTDSSVRYPDQIGSHPRGCGNFARVLALYVREKGVLKLEQALRQMTSRPAEIFGIGNRARLRPGYAADLVVFDPAGIQDHATYVNPLEPPTGIDYVVVNGKIVAREGQLDEKLLAGRAVRLRRPSVIPSKPVSMAAEAEGAAKPRSGARSWAPAANPKKTKRR